MRLVVTVRTVKHHVPNLLVKLGARVRAHAVALAYRRRTLDQPILAQAWSSCRPLAAQTPNREYRWCAEILACGYPLQTRLRPLRLAS